MEQSLATGSAAAHPAASTETDQTAPIGRAGAAGRGLDPQSAFRTNDFLANAKPRRALAGELGSVIPSLPTRRLARLHLVLPGREGLGRQRITPSAFGNLQMHGRRRLARGQIQPVQHLVAAAVPAWSLEGAVLIHPRGTPLARGREGASEK